MGIRNNDSLEKNLLNTAELLYNINGMECGRAHMYIEGRVQGVFYRVFARDTAMNLGLSGWVRNLYDGRVEAVLEGNHEHIKKALGEYRKGPPGASVTHIEITWETCTGEAKGFDIRYG